MEAQRYVALCDQVIIRRQYLDNFTNDFSGGNKMPNQYREPFVVREVAPFKINGQAIPYPEFFSANVSR